MRQAKPDYEPIVNRAKELITQLALGEEFDWRTLFGEEEWAEIRHDFSAQTVGRELSRQLVECASPRIEFLRVGSTRRSIFRKIRELGGE